MTCARCGYVREDLTLSDRVFVCPKCGWIVDRDYNASLNILRRSGSERPLVWSSAFYRWQGEGVKQEALSVRAR
ncbi:transposase [Saccharolobus solfataricus]|uniref:Transposase n=1 Tax=Saccharolobus solfataricus TaxID=2287 RepID=A0A157T4S1_SACSO|nr:transposase [Saccharolobus solfataricus]SAI86249.1 OrfB transposase partial, IS605 family [Saccharolobus solfataricus]